MRETLIKASKTGLGVFMTAIPGAYVFREAVGYVARSDGISMQIQSLWDQGCLWGINFHGFHGLPIPTYLYVMHQLPTKNVPKNPRMIPQYIMEGTFLSPRHPDKYLILLSTRIEGDIVQVLNVDKRTIQIPKDYCWVEGDNARLGQDSRYYGLISLGLIKAKVTLAGSDKNHQGAWMFKYVKKKYSRF